MGILEEHDLGLGQPEGLPSVRQVGGDDAAEREPEVTGAVEFGLHPRGVGGEVLERAVDAVDAEAMHGSMSNGPGHGTAVSVCQRGYTTIVRDGPYDG